MITLCLPHHAMVTRTEMISKAWPDLLRVLWREQHPESHEQTAFDFTAEQPLMKVIPLFCGDGSD